MAYEPLWAIGTGVAAGTDQIEPVHAVIRGALEEADPVKGGAIRILYGGSVKPQNAAEIIALPDVDGRPGRRGRRSTQGTFIGFAPQCGDIGL